MDSPRWSHYTPRLSSRDKSISSSYLMFFRCNSVSRTSEPTLSGMLWTIRSLPLRHVLLASHPISDTLATRNSICDHGRCILCTVHTSCVSEWLCNNNNNNNKGQAPQKTQRQDGKTHDESLYSVPTSTYHSNSRTIPSRPFHLPNGRGILRTLVANIQDTVLQNLIMSAKSNSSTSTYDRNKYCTFDTKRVLQIAALNSNTMCSQQTTSRQVTTLPNCMYIQLVHPIGRTTELANVKGINSTLGKPLRRQIYPSKKLH